MSMLLKFIEHPKIRVIRFAACIGTAAALIFVSALSYAQLPAVTRGQIDPVATEHRFTTVETELAEIIREIADLKSMEWVKVLALSGLIGEAGIRVYARKTRRFDDRGGAE